MAAQNEEFFSEAEVYQALSWGMPDSEARQHAKYMTGDPAVIATLPTFRDLGPLTTNYSEGFLLVISLVSDETRRKAERKLAASRLEKELSPDERAEWERRRAELRSQLIQAGKKLPER